MPTRYTEAHTCMSVKMRSSLCMHFPKLLTVTSYVTRHTATPEADYIFTRALKKCVRYSTVLCERSNTAQFITPAAYHHLHWITARLLVTHHMQTNSPFTSSCELAYNLSG